ncbi:hypothetical protein ACWCOV_24590 [Kribbella sp. NPDC002412]
MASFGGIDLGADGAAVFELTSQTDDEDFIYPLPDGSAVVVPASSRYVVVRQCPGATFDEVHGNAREAANRAIDVYLGLRGRPLVLAHKDSAYLVAWQSQTGHTLRLVGRIQVSTRVRAKGEVRHADGTLVIPAELPPPQAWHECLRYYRVSESATDLFDSFRSLYLAVESLLSDVVPPVPKPNGQPEGDSAWLKRALQVVGLAVDLRPYAPPSQQAAHNAIHRELYRSLRTAIFNSKKGRATWTPQAWSSRAVVVEARIRYARMFRTLAAEYLGMRYPSGGFVQAAWETAWETVLSDTRVFVSDDPTKVDDEPSGQYQIAPAGGAWVELPTAASEDMSTDWCRGVMGVESAPTVHQSLSPIRRFGTLKGGELTMVENLSAPLVINGFDQVQVVMLVEGRTYGQPRQDFES